MSPTVTPATTERSVATDRLRKAEAVAWMASWIAVAIFFGLGPVTVSIGDLRWLSGCVAVGVLMTVVQAARVGSVARSQHDRLNRLVAGVAAFYPLTVLGLMWHLAYGFLYWIFNFGLSWFMRPGTEAPVFRYASLVSLVVPVVLGWGFVHVAVVSMADRLYGGERPERSLAFRKAVRNNRLLVAASVLGIVITLVVLVYIVLYAHSLRNLMLVQFSVLVVSSQLWALGKNEEGSAAAAASARVAAEALAPAPATRADGLKALAKLLEAAQYEVVSLADSVDPFSAGVDLIGLLKPAAIAIVAIGPDESDSAAHVKTAAALRPFAWEYIRRYFPRSVSSVDAVLVFVELEPDAALMHFAGQELLRVIRLSGERINSILELQDEDTLRQAAGDLLNLNPDGLGRVESHADK